MERKREIIIQNQENGLMLLPWISARYTYHSMDKWKQYINDERIKINDCKVISETILNKGDKVTYYPEPIIEPPVNSDYEVVYEDTDLLVLNKPSDLPCHPGGVYSKNTLWYLLKQKYEYISLVNRLDRETSGIMLIAKNKVSATFYFKKMMDREIEKEYLVLVHGVLKENLDARGWLIKDSDSIIEKKRKFILDEKALQEDGSGDPNREFSHSVFTTIQSNDKYSLVKCKIFTGRTHQIRVTICSLGYPVVGDKIYGVDDTFFFKFINGKLTKDDWSNLVLNNQALHSCKTTVPMMNGEKKTFISSPPSNWPVQ
ncbi:MAG: RluA family pseudouridine synthase [Spirochaetaceae bacterium]|nr:RluA family pseudouridine synthase [Spirochaetaceae bacterium]